MKRMVDRRQDHADAKADAAGALTDRREGEVRRTVVRPHRAEVVLGKPHAVEALLFGIGDLVQRLVDALRLTLRGPRLRHLDLIEQANSHPARSAGYGDHSNGERIAQNETGRRPLARS